MPGPDRNLPLLPQFTRLVSLPSGMAWNVSTRFNADFEVAIILYDAVTLEPAHTFGNYSRSNPGMDGPVIGPVRGVWNVLLTGWHKNSRPNSRRPWFQSRTRLRRLGINSYRFSMDDGGGDGDFDDGVLTLTDLPVQVI